LFFAIATVFAFEFYLPNRYGRDALRLAFLLSVLPFAAAMILNVSRQAAAAGKTSRALVCILLPFALGQISLARPLFKHAATPAIHAWLSATPKQTLVAGVSSEIDMVPAIAKRSIYFGYEFALPVKKNYHRAIEQRANTFIRAFFAPDNSSFAILVEASGIDYVLLNTHFLQRRKAQMRRLVFLALSFRGARQAFRFLLTGGKPFFQDRVATCWVVSERAYVLLDAKCLANES